MMRILPSVILLLLAISISFAIDLPEPPEGFAWRETPAIQGALLVPKGWHFREEKAGRTLAFFISEDEFIPPEKYLIGVNINAFLNNPGAPAGVEQHLRAQAEHYSVDLVQGTFGPFKTIQCQYELPKTADHDVIRVFHLGIVNPATNASYLVMFESPSAQWSRVWPIGETIVKTLALNGSI